MKRKTFTVLFFIKKNQLLKKRRSACSYENYG